jgi:penicillin-binding protein 2
MYEVTNGGGGTATGSVAHSKVTIAGKTGTAQVVGIPQSEKKRMQEHEMEYYQRSHAWLTTYGPYKNPKYSVTILVEHGGHGASAAGDITANIYNKMLELGYFDQNSTK